MRILEETKNPDLAKGFADLLKDRDIDYKLESIVNTNWGDDHYGESLFKIWIVDEDQFYQAETLLNLYKDDPKSEEVKLKKQKKQSIFENEAPIPLEPDPPVINKGPLTVTRYVMLLCIAFFVLQIISTPFNKPNVNSGLYVPSPVEQKLLFDFPEAAELYTNTLKIYYNPSNETIPKEGRFLLNKALNTPYWDGFYDTFSLEAKGEDTEWKEAPWFEKISQGEFWRFITPAFLHGSLLHILFNLLWFWMLGKEIEKTIGPLRIVALILIIAFVSNTLQYLMTGFQFLGLSGVVAGFLMFIGERQRVAPWEGYTLQRSVYFFLLFYIFGLAAIQSLAFLGSLAGLPDLPISIANTAHVAGAITGFILGRLKLFAWKG